MEGKANGVSGDGVIHYALLVRFLLLSALIPLSPRYRMSFRVAILVLPILLRRKVLSSIILHALYRFFLQL